MAIKPGLRARQSQRLTLTPALRQSISILGLSATALDELVAREIEQNPLMNLETDRPSSDTNSFQFATDTVATKPSLTAQLHDQIITLSDHGKTQQLAIYLAGNLTDQGYLPNTANGIAADLGLELELVEAAINVVQACDPTGIGAFDLKNCLDLQFAALGENPATRLAVLENIDLFAANDWKKLAKITGLPEHELRRLSELLHSLNPFPAESLVPDTLEVLRPDVKVTENSEGGFDVALLGSVTPSLLVDRRLFDITLARDPASKDYLQEQLNRSSALRRAIEARSKTVLRVCQNIVATQYRFFSGDMGQLYPQTRAKMALDLNLHASTVSRAIANKSLECSLGSFPLKFFFTAALDPLDAGPARSAYGVQLEMRRLINTETPFNILSDERITALLRQSGVDIARRTVAKYRQCLNIPTSAQRRRSKKFL